MKIMKHIALLMAIFGLMMSCSPFKVVSDFDPQADFTEYKTYALKLDELNLNDIDKSRVAGELERQLALKNMQPAENPAVEIKVKAHHKVVQNNHITPSIHLGGWSRWIGVGVGLGKTFYNQSNQGTLVFEFYDTKTGKMVWQGSGSGINVDNPQSKQEQIPKIISEILKNFPPKK